jgi:hypothetical protein
MVVMTPDPEIIPSPSVGDPFKRRVEALFAGHDISNGDVHSGYRPIGKPDQAFGDLGEVGRVESSLSG